MPCVVAGCLNELAQWCWRANGVHATFFCVPHAGDDVVSKTTALGMGLSESDLTRIEYKQESNPLCRGVAPRYFLKSECEYLLGKVREERRAAQQQKVAAGQAEADGRQVS